MEKIYILSHTDLDGYVSAGLAEYFETLKSTEPCEFKHKSWTYGRDIPNIEKIVREYDKFILVDLCLDDKSMDTLCKIYRKNFIWIDHHVTPDNKYLDHCNHDLCCNYYLAEKEHLYAACALVWKYYSDDHKNHIPYWLKLVSDFDCWNKWNDQVWNEEVMPYFSYLKSRISSPADCIKYLNELDYRINVLGPMTGITKQTDPNYKYSIRIIQDDIEKGSYMYKSTKEIYNAECKHGFEAELNVTLDRFKDCQSQEKFSISDLANMTKIKAWVCNTQNRSSLIFEDMKNLDDYDVVIPYHFNGQKFYYSMYTFKKEIQCNRIRVYFMKNNQMEFADFNGHDDAAGTNSEYFIITPTVKE